MYDLQYSCRVFVIILFLFNFLQDGYIESRSPRLGQIASGHTRPHGNLINCKLMRDVIVHAVWFFAKDMKWRIESLNYCPVISRIARSQQLHTTKNRKRPFLMCISHAFWKYYEIWTAFETTYIRCGVDILRKLCATLERLQINFVLCKKCCLLMLRCVRDDAFVAANMLVFM